MKKNKDFVRIIAMSMCALLLLTILVMFTGCSKADTASPIEPVRTERVIIYLPDGEKIEGEVETSVVYSYGEVIVRVNGVKYTTHLSNVLFIEEGG